MIRVASVIALLAVLVGAVLFNIRARSAPAIPADIPPRTSAEVVPVSVATAVRGAASETVTVPGVLRSEQQAVLSLRSPVRISSVLVRDGDRVAKGQLLLRLDHAEFAGQLGGADAAVDAASAQLRKAVDGRTARDVELGAKESEARSGLVTANSRLEQAELGSKLSDVNISADSARARGAVVQATAAAAQARAAWDQAEKTATRLEFLYAHGGVPRVEAEGARTQATVAKSQYDAALAGLRQAEDAQRPASEAAPLRARVSQADVDAARAGVRQAAEGVANARAARRAALAVADRDIEGARAALRQAQAGARQTSEQVGSPTIASPLDGVVVSLAAHAGENMQPGQQLLTVIGSGELIVEGFVNAETAALLRPGQPATVSVDGQLGRMFPARVDRVLPQESTDARTTLVRLKLAAGAFRAQPGLAATAAITVPSASNDIVVPIDAVRGEAGRSFVFLADGGAARKQWVIVRKMEGVSAFISSGIRPGAQVVVSAPSALEQGVRIRIVRN